MRVRFAKPGVVVAVILLGAVTLLLSHSPYDGPRIDGSIVRTCIVQRLVTPAGPGLFMEPPIGTSPNSRTAVWKLIQKGKIAARVEVKFAREYLGFIEVTEGLSEGDEVILSDMSIYGSFDEVRIS